MTITLAPNALLEKLLAAGLLVPTGVDGLNGRSAVLEELLDQLDDLVSALVAEDSAERLRFPRALPRRTLGGSGYIKGFPHSAGTVHAFVGDDRDRRSRSAATPAPLHPRSRPVRSRRGERRRHPSHGTARDPVRGHLHPTRGRRGTARGRAGGSSARWRATHGRASDRRASVPPRESRAGIGCAPSSCCPDSRPGGPGRTASPRSTPVRHDRRRAARARSDGFPSVGIDRGQDGCGFGFRINGVPLFERRADPMKVDPVDLAVGREAVGPGLRLFREAGCNVLRVPGTTVYDDDPLRERFDELGIPVRQEPMLPDLDCPVEEPTRRAAPLEEAKALLDRTQRHPSLTLLYGGSEIAHRAATHGQWESAEPRPTGFTSELAALVERLRLDPPFLPHSPMGGSRPFALDEGPRHACALGACLRPIAEAQAAPPRFPARCLALAGLPEAASLARMVPADVGVGHDRRCKTLVPRDCRGSWDFEDVREHYLEELLGVDARQLRRVDPERRLERSRATAFERERRVRTAWRRPGSPCRGALVRHARDLSPGTGFGVLDAFGLPRPARHAMNQVLKPFRLLPTDEALDGIDVLLSNDPPGSAAVRLEILCLCEGGVPIARGVRELRVEGHGAVTFSVFRVLPGFVDPSCAYRSGPSRRDAVVAPIFHPHTETLLDEPTHPIGRHEPRRRDPGLEAALERGPDGRRPQLRCRPLARFVRIDDEAFRVASAWFQSTPGRDRLLDREPLPAGRGFRSSGRVHTIGCSYPIAEGEGAGGTQP